MRCKQQLCKQQLCQRACLSCILMDELVQNPW